MSEIRVGVYDSRAIAMAYWGREVEGKPRYDHPDFSSPDIVRDYWSQEVDGKPRYVPPESEELEGREVEYMLHQQFFSYHEPVQAFEYIADRIPGLKEQAGVDVIVSKWDREELAKYGVRGSGWDIPDSADDEMDKGWDRAGLVENNPGKVVEITDAFTQLYNVPAGFSEELVNIKNQKPAPFDTNWLEAEE